MSALKNVLQRLFLLNKRLSPQTSVSADADCFVLDKDFDFANIPSCPVCNSNQVATFIYGKPSLTRLIIEGFESGKFISGGCMIRESAPKWHCYNCNRDFGRLL